MRIPSITSKTPDLTRAISLVKTAVDPILIDPFTSGKTITDVAVTSGTTFVLKHGLGRAPTGAFVVDVQGTAQITVRRDSTYTPAPDPTVALALVPSGTGTVAIRVF